MKQIIAIANVEAIPIYKVIRKFFKTNIFMVAFTLVSPKMYFGLEKVLC